MAPILNRSTFQKKTMFSNQTRDIGVSGTILHASDSNAQRAFEKHQWVAGESLCIKESDVPRIFIEALGYIYCF